MNTAWPRKTTVRVTSVRPMTVADLEGLRQPSARPDITKIRHVHHHIAQLLASGMTQVDVARTVGFSVTRIGILANSPAMGELIAKYRTDILDGRRESLDAYTAEKTKNMIMAERMIGEQLEDACEEGTQLPLKTLLAISSDGADRFGYHKKSASLNVNIDFAAKLEAAISRSGKVLELKRTGA